MKNEISKSWDGVADWYDELLGEGDTYQGKLILPNLMRLLGIKKGEVVLDLACGQGFFSRAFFAAGAKVIGVDISPKMIALAKKNSTTDIAFGVASAEKLPFLSNQSIDKSVIILAIQNMENINNVFAECYRILKLQGRLLIVMNHPAFRIPKESSWGWDPERRIQYRRIDRYLSGAKIKIQTHPGDKPEQCTISFHRPLQSYFKSLSKNGFLISRLEEWSSSKKSEPGPRAVAENRARIEIPLFLFLEAVRV